MCQLIKLFIYQYLWILNNLFIYSIMFYKFFNKILLMKVFSSLIVWLIFISTSKAQNTLFTFTKNGLTESVTMVFNGIQKKDLYDKTLNWLTESQQKNKLHIKEIKKDKFICFEEIKSKILCDRYLEELNCYDFKYTVLLTFFDNSYKMEVLKIEVLYPNVYEKTSEWKEFSVKPDDIKRYFKRNGTIQTRYIMYPSTIATIFNSFNQNLTNYINSGS